MWKMEERVGEEKDKYWQQTDVYRKYTDLSEDMKVQSE